MEVVLEKYVVFSMQSFLNNLVDIFEQSCLLNSKKIALVFGSKKITYKELYDIVNRLSFSLYRLGVEEKDKIALWLPNCLEFVYSFFAILKLKAIIVPINNMFKREEAKFILEDSSAKILFCSIDKVSDAKNLLTRLSSLKYIISNPVPKDDKTLINFYDLINSNIEIFERKINIERSDIAEIIYTSGTTGRPKGAVLTHGNLISNISDCAKVIKLKRKDAVICLLPLFHSFASTVCMLLPIYVGAKIVIMRSIKPFKRIIRTIFKHRITIFVGIPSLYNILVESNFSKFFLFLSRFINPIRLCISGASALSFKTQESFEKKFKRPLREGYGLTEASPVVSLNPLKINKPYSVGLPLPSVKVKVVDKYNRELPNNTVGELIVKGPNVMSGYYNLEDATRETIKDGWLYTGDLAKIDDEGFIYIMGRIKDMINVRGLNVYPKEIEDLLYRLKEIKEVAVIGVLHKHKEEAPIAFVVKEGNITEKEILDYLKANLASYKIPLRIFFKDSLPKNSTGKILKTELKKEVENIFI